MKQSVIATVISLISLAACGGSVTLPSDTISSSNGGASSSSSDDATSSSSVGTGGAGGWSNQGGGGQGGTGGQEPATLLLVTDDGASDSDVRLCTINVIGLAYGFVPQQGHNITIKHQHLRIESIDGGRIVGSAGTRYFSNIKLTDSATNMVYRGPIEIDTNISPPTAADIEFSDAFLVPDERHITMISDVICAEDAPGEIVGHHYRVTWKSMTDGDAFDETTNTSLDPASIQPNTEIIGPTFVVTMSQ